MIIRAATTSINDGHGTGYRKHTVFVHRMIGPVLSIHGDISVNARN